MLQTGELRLNYPKALQFVYPEDMTQKFRQHWWAAFSYSYGRDSHISIVQSNKTAVLLVFPNFFQFTLGYGDKESKVIPIIAEFTNEDDFDNLIKIIEVIFVCVR